MINFDKYPGSLSSKDLTEGALLENFKFEVLLLVSTEDLVEFKLFIFKLLTEDIEIEDEDENVWLAKRLFSEFEDNSFVLLERKPELDDFCDDATVDRFSIIDLFGTELELEDLFWDELDINWLFEDELFSEELNTNSFFEDEDDTISLLEDLDELFSYELEISLLLEEDELFLDELWIFELELELEFEFLSLVWLLDFEGLADDDSEFIKSELLDAELADDEEEFFEIKLLGVAFSLLVLFEELEVTLLFGLSYISKHLDLSELNLKPSSHISQISGIVHFLQKSIELHFSSWVNINTNCINNNKKNILFVLIKEIVIFYLNVFAKWIFVK